MKLCKNANDGTVIYLTTNQQKQILGGLEDPTISSCSVTCEDGEVKSKDCGRGVSCTTNGTTISCGGGDGEDMCKKSL